MKIQYHRACVYGALLVGALAVSACVGAGTRQPPPAQPAAPGDVATGVRSLANFDPGSSGAQIGKGFDSLGLEVKPNPCVVFAGSQDLDTLVGNGVNAQSTHYDSERVRSVEDFWRALNLNASASFGFGFYSGDASVKYYRSSRMSRYSESLVLSVTVTNLTESLKKAVFTEGAMKRLDNPIEFAKFCGDEAIVGRVTGGQFVAIVQISSETAQEQEDASASLSAAGATWDASLSVHEELARFVNQGRLTLKVLRDGTEDNLPDDTSLDGLEDYAKSFPRKVRPPESEGPDDKGGKPWPILAITSSYDGVEVPGSIPSHGSGVTSSTPELDADMTTLAVGYGGVLRRIAELEYLKQNVDGEQFAPYSPTLIGGELSKAKELKTKLEERAKRCLENFSEWKEVKCPWYWPCCKKPQKPGRCPTEIVTIPDTPERIRWVYINVRSEAWQIIDVVPSVSKAPDDKRWAWYRGQWSPVDTADLWYGPGKQSRILFRKLSTGEEQIVDTAGTQEIPNEESAVEVSARVEDGPSGYGDNRPKQGDEARVGLYGPLLQMAE